MRNEAAFSGETLGSTAQTSPLNARRLVAPDCEETVWTPLRPETEANPRLFRALLGVVLIILSRSLRYSHENTFSLCASGSESDFTDPVSLSPRHGGLQSVGSLPPFQGSPQWPTGVQEGNTKPPLTLFHLKNEMLSGLCYPLEHRPSLAPPLG